MEINNNENETPAQNDVKEDMENSVAIMEVIPMERFPNIWKMIFDNLVRLDDLQSAINTCEDWKRALHSNRKLWLFPKVFPFITRHLKRDEVLNLRTVCTSWSQGVDEFIENASHLAPYNEHRHRQNGSARRVPVWKQTDWNFPYFINSLADIPLDDEAFAESMRDHPRNPFVGRELAIHENNLFDLPTAQLMERVARFLSIFGHHLFYLNLESNESESLTDLSALIEGILQNVPNLRQLRVAVADSNFPEQTEEMQEMHLLPPVISSLRTLQLDYDAFPTGARLVELTPASDLVRAYSGQLGRFEVTGLRANRWTTCDWPRLTELRVTIDPMCGITLSNLLDLKAPQLAKLELKLPRGTFSLQELSRIVRNFPKLHPLRMTIEY